ncbi:PREDICTED: neuroblastoma breakpoint family member 4-like [Chinchilla lanigera]|uniref:neuroblastoma breakpoint family member 4-like n=1 Tax=Chinchilla lanigera TaxID=34839 RepID=UPI000698F6EA|nr:PREDICTED: neuroblastoma breakpoint family member 4-like [Chinchilla lanigera]XP_013377939.1 PREDICTED: neuroblastoma breakpoint family member 4-like [Chinchilla lanigera]XP_013377940.1 PREDICTED: neuroblastoma breakpoint family member 4-like [Chinchilla lanigera]
MGIPIDPSCHSKAELSISETEQELRLQLEESKEKFHELKGHFLLSEATVYSMANELKKHNCRKFKDIIESVLGEKLQYKEESLAEKLSLAKNQRECTLQTQDQDGKLSLLQQKLQQGRHASFLLCQHLKDILTRNDPNTNQGHCFRELLAEGVRLAENLVQLLSSDNHQDEECKKEHELLSPRMNPEGANKEKIEQILQDSLLGDFTPSSHGCSLCNTEEPPRTTGNLTDERELSFFLEKNYPQDAENQDKEAEPVEPRFLQEKEDKNNVLQEKMNENLLAISHCQDLCVSHQPGKSPAPETEEHVAPSNLNVTKNQDNEDNEKEQEFLALRLSTEGMEKEKITELLQDSLGEGPKTRTRHYNLPDNQEPCCTAAVLADAHEVSSSLDAAQNTHDYKDEDPQPKASRKYFGIIQAHAKKLSQLRKQLSEAKDTSLSLGQHLEFLLTQDDAEGYQVQGHIQQLAQGCKMAENLVLKLSEGNNEQGNNGKEEKELLSKMDDEDGDFNFLIEVQAQDLTKFRLKLEAGRETAFMLHQTLSSLFPEDDQHGHQMQSHRDRLAEGCKLAKCLACRLSSDNLDEENEDDQMILDSSLCEEEEGELLPHPLDEKYLLPTCHPDVAEPQECAGGDASPSQKPEQYSALGGSATMKEACAQGLSNGEFSSHFSELQASQAQVESRIQGNPRLGIQLCQYFDYPDCKARLSLSSATWGFAASTHCGSQCQPFQELNLDASFGIKGSPKLEGYAFEGSAAVIRGFPIHGLCDTDSVLKQKIMKTKLWLCKWKRACRVPGLQLKMGISRGMNNYYKLESDACAGSAAIIHRFPIHDLYDADSVSKEKITKKELPLCKWKIACRFPGLHA